MVTLALLAALSETGLRVRAAKSGPDYLDPQFLAAASGRPCLTLDAWAMAPERIRARARTGDPLLVVEGAMGLHDGALDAEDPRGRGSTAELAIILGLPVVLVLDVARQMQSAAALAAGLASYRPGLEVAAVILNRVRSPRHRRGVERAFAPLGLPVLGALPECPQLATPSRHLGLVQAREMADLPDRIQAAAALARGVDLARLRALAGPIRPEAAANGSPGPGGERAIPPPGQRIAFARDDGFAFAYAHLLDSWRRQGAELFPFSPLADEAPAAGADAVYLPGGYPELHAGRLAAGTGFAAGMRAAAAAGALVYGECGGYMVLGRALIDGDGRRHAMLDLLPLETRMGGGPVLGYRRLRPLPGASWPGTAVTAHEFHYAREVRLDGRARPLFAARDSDGLPLADLGLRRGRVMGSFAHVIDGA